MKFEIYAISVNRHRQHSILSLHYDCRHEFKNLLWFNNFRFLYDMVYSETYVSYRHTHALVIVTVVVLACKVSRWNGKCSETRLPTFIKFQPAATDATHVAVTVIIRYRQYRITFDDFVLSYWKTLQKYDYKYKCTN